MVFQIQDRNSPSMRILCFLGLCSTLTPGLLGQGQRKGLTLVKEWHQLEWAYSSDAERQQAIASHEFVEGNGVPIDMDVFYGGDSNTKVFVTVPRFVDGIPGTLNTVSAQQAANGDPLLVPYPSWEWHRNSEACSSERLISVFRIQIDECGRLWVLDSGKIGSKQLCKAQIIAFDPRTDRVLHRYEIPSDQMTQYTLLVTPVVDVRDPQAGCLDTFVYAADVTGFSLFVHEVRRNRSWKINNKLFFPYPSHGTFHIAGESFDLMDGILGMSLSPYQPGKDRTLFFHALASVTENHVSTAVLRNHTLFHEAPDAAIDAFRVFPRTRPSQSAAEAIDRNGVMYFGLASEIAMACWNTQTDFNDRNFDLFDRNQQTLQFASGVKIVNNRKNKQELWVMTCRFQKIMTGTINSSEVNFRIQVASTDDILQNSKCGRPGSTGNRGQGGGYGLANINRPQANWGGIFTGKATSNRVIIPPKREVSSEDNDRLIFTN